jgi:cytochrome c-type biogenesis protein CcmE
MTSVHDAVVALGNFAKVTTYTNEEWKTNHEQGYSPQASEETTKEGATSSAEPDRSEHDA